MQNITDSNGLFTFEGYNQVSANLLEFLVINEQKKAVLMDALDDAHAQTTDFVLNNYQLLDECVEIDTAIANLESKVSEQLTKMSGSFMMGTNDAEIERLCKRYDRDWPKVEAPQHRVTLQPFYMAKYPITQAQYQAIMGKNPSRFKGKNNPVECVSWHEAQEFCQKISQRTGKKYQLPSEAQWEYACRAETTTAYYFGDNESQLGEYAWYEDNSEGKTRPVGQKKPNQWGLYDMHGNVWEWCEDNGHDNYEGAPTDGSAWITGNSNTAVVRGGSWVNSPNDCRSAFRNFILRRSDFINVVGFRVVWGLGRDS